MSDIPKVCATCKYFMFAPAQAGYSEYTPGSDCSISCNRGHWSVDAWEETDISYRRKQLTALTCPDYELVLFDVEPWPVKGQ